MTTHDQMARRAGEAILRKWKTSEPGWNAVVGPTVGHSKTKQTFPSPDKSYWDPDKRWNIHCEFKPPGAEKRDIISTGLGQALLYLHSEVGGQASYQIVPEITTDGFNCEDFLRTIYIDRVSGNLPMGLISYPLDDPSLVKLVVEVDPSTIVGAGSVPAMLDRFWAKWQDLTTSMLWNILDVAYQCPRVGDLNPGDNRRHLVMCQYWDERHAPPTVRTLATPEPHIFWAPLMSTSPTWRKKTLSNGKPYPGTPMNPGGKIRADFNRQVQAGRLSPHKAQEQIRLYFQDKSTRSRCYKEVWKNFFLFLDHLGLWDADCNLTDTGWEIHRLGITADYNSRIFVDHFASLILKEGSHFGLIQDLDEFTAGKNLGPRRDALAAFASHYAAQGYLGLNPNRRTPNPGGTDPLKYEILLWEKLGLLSRAGVVYLTAGVDDRGWHDGGRGFLFNHRRISELMAFR